MIPAETRQSQIRFKTVPDLLRDRVAHTPHAPAYAVPSDDGGWHEISWAQFDQDVSRLASGLSHRGVEHGHTIGIAARVGLEWELTQMAALTLGAAVVGLDSNDAQDVLWLKIRQSNISVLFVDDSAHLRELPGDITQRLQLTCLMGTDLPSDWEAPSVPFSELMQSDGQRPGEHPQVLAETPAFITFTSGTTGRPKGISFTHQQVCTACVAILEQFPGVPQGSHLACWLPLANLFQRIVNICSIGRGAVTFFVPDPAQIIQKLPSINPHLFIAVPRFYEKVYAAIEQEIESSAPWKRAMAARAMSVADEVAGLRQHNRPVPLALVIALAVLDKIVLKRLRALFGSNMTTMISGSAPMPHWLLDRYASMGLPILEAYGTSESIVPICSNRTDQFRFGTVGRPLRENHVKLAADGELLVKGAGVFTGYLDEPNPPNRDSDGYLATGDFGRIDEAGFVSIEGRKSEVFKLSTGHRVAPAAIEAKLRAIPGVDHAVVFGENEKTTVALLFMEAAGTPAISPQENPGAMPNDVAAARSAALELTRSVPAAVAALPRYQQPAGVVPIQTPLTIQSGTLTPNLKVRRAEVQRRYQPILDELRQALLQESKKANETGDGPGPYPLVKTA